MLNILIDGTPIRPNPSGIGLYAYHLIEEFYKLQEREKFHLAIAFQPSMRNWLKRNLATPKGIDRYNDIRCLPVPVSITNLLTRYPNPFLSTWESYLKASDILHGLDHVVFPARDRLKVMTIHDVTFIKYPEFVTSIVRGYSDRVRRCLQWTDLIIANSESTKRDIIQYFRVPEEKIRVTLLASRYSDVSNADPIDLPYLDKPYFLFVSTLEPRKNIVNLVKAFDYLKAKYKLEHRLLLVGKKGWHYEPIFEAIAASPFRESIVHLDYLPDEAIVGYYQNAELLIYPSIYEGFGLPVLEAMTLGCPVVTSNTASLPEIASDAAVLVNPSDPLEIAEGMIRVVSDSEFRKSLIQKGEQRAREFSWQKTARETLEAYRSLF